MTKRIFRSILLVALAVLSASVLLIMGVLYGYFSDVQQAQLDMQLELAARGAEAQGRGFFEGFQPKDYRVTWVGPKGEVLFDSHSPGGENHMEREEVREAMESGRGESRRYSSTLLERALYTARRLEDGSVLRLSMSQRSVFTLLLGMAQPVCIVFIIATGLSIFFAVRLSKHIVRPLARLDPDHPLEGRGYREIAPLLRRIDSQQEELKRKQRELERAGQARREFTANVSHELKTPLQSISGYAELLENDMVKPEDIPAFAGRIYRESQRMVRLVEDIISLSRLDEGARGMDWTETDLYELALQAAGGLGDRGDVHIEVEGERAPILGIPQLLYSIIYNLLDNAVKYNRPGGRVDIIARTERGGVRLTVRDTGIGIPESEQERIFERFYRVDKSRSKEVGGTGLGLSIVKHAVMVHQGEISLRSAPGEGTVVEVFFPAPFPHGLLNS